jgi:4-alpha-glucanotransferase
MIRLGMMCAADVCIVPIQDWLGLDNSARMNTPGTVENNWTWRMKKDLIPETLGDEILALTKRFGRANWDALNALEKAEEEEDEKEDENE